MDNQKNNKITKEDAISFGYEIKLTASNQRNKQTFLKIYPAFKTKQLKELKGALLSIFICYALHSNENGYTWVNDRTVKKETGYSITSEIRQKLIKMGYLYQSRLIDEENKFRDYIYRILQPVEPGRKFIINGILQKVPIPPKACYMKKPIQGKPEGVIEDPNNIINNNNINNNNNIIDQDNNNNINNINIKDQDNNNTSIKEHASIEHASIIQHASNIQHASIKEHASNNNIINNNIINNADELLVYQEDNLNNNKSFLPLVNYFVTKCQELRGYKPELPSFAVIGSLIKRRRQSLSDNEIQELMVFYLNSDKCRKYGGSIKTALSDSTVNEWREAKRKTSWMENV